MCRWRNGRHCAISISDGVRFPGGRGRATRRPAGLAEPAQRLLGGTDVGAAIDELAARGKIIDDDGRVHSCFHPARSFSGRLVNTNPDLGRVPGRAPLPPAPGRRP